MEQQPVVRVVLVADLVALKYAIMLNGVTQLFMMKIDVMNQFDTIKVCTAYKYKGSVIKYLPKRFGKRRTNIY